MCVYTYYIYSKFEWLGLFGFFILFSLSLFDIILCYHRSLAKQTKHKSTLIN